MLIDCDRCAVRGAACSGCVVHALFEAPAGLEGLTAAEHRAIEALDRAGLDVEVLEVLEKPALPVTPQRRRHVA
jgi:hypothetical protein